MNEMERMARVADIARGLDEPGRTEEAVGYHKAIIDTLNGIHKNGEQDALCVFEGIAHVLAQLIANVDDSHRCGILEFVTVRANVLAPLYAESGKGAGYRFEAKPGLPDFAAQRGG